MQVNTMLSTDQDPEEVTTMTKEKYICHTLRKERNTTRMYLEWNPHGQEETRMTKTVMEMYNVKDSGEYWEDME